MWYWIAGYLVIGFLLHWANDVGHKKMGNPPVPWYKVWITMVFWPLLLLLAIWVESGR